MKGDHRLILTAVNGREEKDSLMCSKIGHGRASSCSSLTKANIIVESKSSAEVLRLPSVTLSSASEQI